MSPSAIAQTAVLQTAALQTAVPQTAVPIATSLRSHQKSGPLYGCIHLPDYPVQAFIRNEPKLRRKPVVVLDGTFPLFTVMAMNKPARGMGISEGMSKLQLEQFKGLVIRHRSREQEDSTHRALLDCAHYFTPRIENTAPDTITLDLNGLSGLWGDPRPIAQRLFRAAAKLGLEAHIGIAPNPEAALHASRGAAGITLLSANDSKNKLAALPLHILPASEDMAHTFRRWGLETFQDLGQLPSDDISGRLGQEGVRLQQMARGETARPLQVINEKPYFKESMEIEDSIDSLEPITFILSRLLKQITERLAVRNRTTNELNLTLKLEPGSPTTGQANASAAQKDFVRTLRLPLPIRDPKILLKLFQLDLETHRPPAPVIGVTLEAEPVEPRSAQNGLFVPLAPEPEKLELTLARIGGIVGEKNIGSPRVLDTHRPDAFHVERFTLPAKSTLPKRQSKTRPQTAHQRAARHSTGLANGLERTSSAPPMALRIFRPAQPATVEMRQGQPSRVLFGGRSGTVITARGPWTASGEWWRQEPWSREEWDVEIQNGWRRELYRIYHDPRRNTWFVDGSYD
jgi:protein ImuB